MEKQRTFAETLAPPAAPPVAMPQTGTRETAHTLVIGLWVKAAFITACPVALIAMILIWAINKGLVWLWPSLSVNWAVILILTALVWLAWFLVCFVILLKQKGIDNFERLTGIDWNGDGSVGGKPGPPQYYRTEIWWHRDENNSEHLDIRVDPKILARFCQNALEGFTSQREMQKRHVSQPSWDKIVKALDYHRLIVWKSEGNPNQGWSLTDEGRAWCEEYLKHPPTPVEGE